MTRLPDDGRTLFDGAIRRRPVQLFGRAPGGTRLLIQEASQAALRPARCGAKCAPTRVKAHAIDQQIRFFVATPAFISTIGGNPNVNRPGNKQQSDVPTAL